MDETSGSLSDKNQNLVTSIEPQSHQSTKKGHNDYCDLDINDRTRLCPKERSESRSTESGESTVLCGGDLAAEYFDEPKPMAVTSERDHSSSDLLNKLGEKASEAKPRTFDKHKSNIATGVLIGDGSFQSHELEAKSVRTLSAEVLHTKFSVLDVDPISGGDARTISRKREMVEHSEADVTGDRLPSKEKSEAKHTSFLSKNDSVKKKHVTFNEHLTEESTEKSKKHVNSASTVDETPVFKKPSTLRSNITSNSGQITTKKKLSENLCEQPGSKLDIGGTTPSFSSTTSNSNKLPAERRKSVDQNETEMQKPSGSLLKSSERKHIVHDGVLVSTSSSARSQATANKAADAVTASSSRTKTSTARVANSDVQNVRTLDSLIESDLQKLPIAGTASNSVVAAVSKTPVQKPAKVRFEGKLQVGY